MNKQELIEKIEAMPNNTGFIRPKIDKHLVLGLVRQLDEPEKVTIPQFVADWYEENKNNFEKNIYDCIVGWGIHSNEIREWIRENKPFQTLINMHQFGYEVEKEKRYIVRLKNIRESHETLNCEKHSKIWNFSSEEETILYKTKHTRKQLEEAGFGWVFDCKGVEVEEVTE